jgi:hypothetical protein
MLHSQFDTSSIFLDPLIAPEKNYRLLPAKPYFLSTDPEMVLNLESDNTLALHFGVKNYGRTATWFDYDGILWCFSSGLIRPK